MCDGEEGGNSQSLISMNTQKKKKSQTEVVPAATTDVCYMYNIILMAY